LNVLQLNRHVHAEAQVPNDYPVALAGWNGQSCLVRVGDVVGYSVWLTMEADGYSVSLRTYRPSFELKRIVPTRMQKSESDQRPIACSTILTRRGDCNVLGDISTLRLRNVPSRGCEHSHALSDRGKIRLRHGVAYNTSRRQTQRGEHADKRRNAHNQNENDTTVFGHHFDSFSSHVAHTQRAIEALPFPFLTELFEKRLEVLWMSMNHAAQNPNSCQTIRVLSRSKRKNPSEKQPESVNEVEYLLIAH